MDHRLHSAGAFLQCIRYFLPSRSRMGARARLLLHLQPLRVSHCARLVPREAHMEPVLIPIVSYYHLAEMVSTHFLQLLT